jgi:hypothetical protein
LCAASSRSERPLRARLAAAVQRVDDRRRWLERPWDFASEVIGQEALDEAARQGGGDHMGPLAQEQRDYLRAFCDVGVRRILLRTARYGSKTFLTALGAAAFLHCIPNFTCTVLSGSFAQAQVLYAYFERFALSPRFSASIIGAPRKARTDFRHGGWIRILAASERQAKGPHPQLLVLDEVCAIDPDILDLALGQKVGTKLGLVRALSTPDKLFHPFWEWDMEAPRYGWRQFSWGLRAFAADGTWAPRFPWVSRASIEDDLQLHDSNWVRVHIDGEWGSATGTVFAFEDVQLARIDDPLEPAARDLLAAQDPSKLDPWWDADAVVSWTLGIDWGFQAPTVITVWARVQPVLASAYAARAAGLADLPADLYYLRHVEAYRQQEATFLLDRVDHLLEEFPASVYMDASHPFECVAVGRIAARRARPATAIPFVRDKMGMVSWMNALLEKRQVRIPKRFAETLGQIAAYEWEEGKERPRKGNDDHVDSSMLGLWGHRAEMGGPGVARLPLRRPP